MRVAILAEGTRGDFAPMAALGARMTRRGHEVDMTASEEFRPMVEAAGARFVPLPVSLTAHIATKKGQRSLNRGWYPAMRGVHELFHRHRVGIEDALLEAAEEADVLVTVLDAHDRAQCLAVANQIPHAFVQFFPVLPTRGLPVRC